MEERTYTFVKNVRGGLTIELETYTMMGISKKFYIPHNVERIVVPYQYALGLFISGSALSQFKLGCFDIVDKETLIKDAVSKGLTAFDEFPGIKVSVDENNQAVVEKTENEKGAVSKEEIEKAVVGNNIVTIRRILAKRNDIDINNLLSLAREHYDTLTSGTIEAIEKACGVELRIE